MMLAEDELSETLVVGDGNLSGLGGCLQYGGIGATRRELGGVYRAMSK
jgi:hypothetical protein